MLEVYTNEGAELNYIYLYIGKLLDIGVEMSKANKIGVQALSVAFFIRRSRVQKLYRSLLRVCDNDNERSQVRDGFRSNLTNKGANIKEAEALLQRVQLARASRRGTNADNGSPVYPPLPSSEESANDDKHDVKIEWPWQRNGT